MQFTPNSRFHAFLKCLRHRVLKQPLPPTAETTEYQQFIAKFPPEKIARLGLQEYCLGTGSNDSFCWWLERGLQPVLGRYVPGTSKGHLLYYGKDGKVAKINALKGMSDEAALQATLKMQSHIANAKLPDVQWIDNDKELLRRAGSDVRSTMGSGRKLRLLSCYHPQELLPITKSEHLGHFLTEFGCPAEKLPRIKQAVARLLMLNDLFDEAKKQVPDLSPNAMMWALYDKELGFAPMKDDADAGDLVPDSENPIQLQDLADYDQAASEADDADLNLILAGPPGTGKTFATIAEAVKIIDPDFYAENHGERRALKARFDELLEDRQIRFTTFHQSFSYEDFVEGLRADRDKTTGKIHYPVVPGVFRAICIDAAMAQQAAMVPQSAQVADDWGLNDAPRIWKISINGAPDNAIRRYCFTHGEARIGWGQPGDLRLANLDDPSFNDKTQTAMYLGPNDKSSLRDFWKDIRSGDVLLCVSSITEICALGVVQGDYEYNDEPPPEVDDRSYQHVRRVNWLLTDIRFPILALNNNTEFALKAVHELPRIKWPELLRALEARGLFLPMATTSAAMPPPTDKRYVLIIDEINRGNISRIFGELITLIEPSKRTGASEPAEALEALEVILPYSKEPFSVPRNVYLIGTMNTADRSLTGLDLALRRRFTFREMPPDAGKLKHIQIEGIVIASLLEAMNQRIEVLLGRDHCIGHAYFMTLKNGHTLQELARVFRNKIMPLLQEYFFDDWQRIAWVLNDQNKVDDDRFVQQVKGDISQIFDGTAIFDEGEGMARQAMPWRINPAAFNNVRSYQAIIKKLP